MVGSQDDSRPDSSGSIVLVWGSHFERVLDTMSPWVRKDF